MSRTLVAVVAALVAAGSAQAEQLTVKLIPANGAANRAQLRLAATAVCREAYRPGGLDSMDECVAATYDRSLWDARRQFPQGFKPAVSFGTVALR